MLDASRAAIEHLTGKKRADLDTNRTILSANQTTGTAIRIFMKSEDMGSLRSTSTQKNFYVLV